MSSTTSPFLRRVLVADAALSGVAALAMIVAPHALERTLQLPAVVLLVAGVALVPFVAYLAYLASRSRIAAGSVRLVIALNVAWVIGSIVLLLGDQVRPNQLGLAFVIAQAAAVAVLAEVQYVALRRAAR